MKILPVLNAKFLTVQQNKLDNSSNVNFKSSHMTKKELNAAKKTVTNILGDQNSVVGAKSKITYSVENILSMNGIKSCNYEGDDFINVKLKHEGFCILKIIQTLCNNSNAEIYVADMITKFKKKVLGGLLNYIDLIQQTGRQDIVMKGLGVNTHELNSKLPMTSDITAAKHLAKFLKNRYLKEDNLFFIDNQAFYFDKIANKVYGINAVETVEKRAKGTMSSCSFIKDNNGNTVGYESETYNYYSGKVKKIKYQEQQAPSEDLPKYADKNNPKLFAESYRFGNSNGSDSQKGAKKVVQLISKKFGLNKIADSELQFIKLPPKDRKDVLRIGYYDPVTGCSYIFDNDGKYLYSLDYNLDRNGNIVSCTKF